MLDERLHRLHVGIIRQQAMLRCLGKPVFVISDYLVKLRRRNSVLHICAIPDLPQEPQIRFRPVRPDFRMLQDVDSHHEQADEMHGVFLQVVGIFCMVPAPTCLIIPHHRMQAVHQLEPFPKRILRDMPFQEKFLFQPFGHRVGDIQPHPRSLFLEAPVVIFQHMASRPQDMRFPFGLRQLVPGNRILQLAKLGVRIVAEGRCDAFAQKQHRMVQQLLAEHGFHHVLVAVQTQNLDGIRVTVQQEPDQFPERIDDGICRPVLKLLELGQPIHGYDLATLDGGLTVRRAETGEQLAELVENGSEFILCRGGKGGLGNNNFKSATNQTPRYAQPGEEGQEGWFILELKVLADVGLVGFPNAGKSTLLASITSAKPKIANYAFTTLEPNLGIVRYHDDRSFVMADIPGIIEGAHEGKGIGLRFLRHIERNSVLLFMVSAEEENVNESYKVLLKELKMYNPELLAKDRILAVTKCDIADDEMRKRVRRHLPKSIPSVLISSVTGEGLPELKDLLWEALNG